jgi:uncharacterized protein YdaU (DUF1376 family)
MTRVKPSHIPVFPDAYLRDNYRLSLEQHGLFMLLMFEAWNKPDCSLPDDERALAEIAQISVARFRKIAGPVLEKWTREGGRIYQKRLLKEWAYVNEKRAKAKAAVEGRWNREKGYERTTDVYSDEVHLGGGGGGGGGQTQGKGLGGEGYAHTREGLTVIAGGAR